MSQVSLDIDSSDARHFVLVYQYGKVASTSLVNAINSVDHVRAVQTHFLGQRALSETVARIAASQTDPFFAKQSFEQLIVNITYTRLLNQFRNGNPPIERLSLLTIVREPLSWFRSAIVQDLNGHLPLIRRISGMDMRGQGISEEAAVERGLRQLLVWMTKLATELSEISDFHPGIPGFREKAAEAIPDKVRDDVVSRFILMLRPHTWFSSHYTPATGMELESFHELRTGLLVRDAGWARAFIVRYEDLDWAFAIVRKELDLPDHVELPKSNLSKDKVLSREVAAAFSGPEAQQLANILGRSRYSRRFGYAPA